MRRALLNLASPLAAHAASALLPPRQVLGQRGSGEFALRFFLEPFAWPLAPLEARLPALKCPVTFVYGESDWIRMIDRGAAERAVAALRAARPGGAPLAPLDLAIVETPAAGHYPQIDQPGVFLAQVLDAVAHLVPPAAAAALRAEVARWPLHARPMEDDAAEFKRAMARNLAEAEARVAADA